MKLLYMTYIYMCPGNERERETGRQAALLASETGLCITLSALVKLIA